MTACAMQGNTGGGWDWPRVRTAQVSEIRGQGCPSPVPGAWLRAVPGGGSGLHHPMGPRVSPARTVKAPVLAGSNFPPHEQEEMVAEAMDPLEDFCPAQGNGPNVQAKILTCPRSKSINIMSEWNCASRGDSTVLELPNHLKLASPALLKAS